MGKLGWVLALLPVTVSLVATSTPARAEVPREHEFILAGDFSISYQHISLSGQDQSVDIFTASPSFDYVVSAGLTLGVGFVFQHVGIGDSSVNSVGLTPRVGYAFEAGPKVFIWPRFGFGYVHNFADLSALGGSISDDSDRVLLQFELYICYSPVHHFFLGIGPVARVDISSSDNNPKLTNIGFASMVGGYF